MPRASLSSSHTPGAGRSDHKGTMRCSTHMVRVIRSLALGYCPDCGGDFFWEDIARSASIHLGQKITPGFVARIALGEVTYGYDGTKNSAGGATPTTSNALKVLQVRCRTDYASMPLDRSSNG